MSDDRIDLWNAPRTQARISVVSFQSASKNILFTSLILGPSRQTLSDHRVKSRTEMSWMHIHNLVANHKCNSQLVITKYSFDITDVSLDHRRHRLEIIVSTVSSETMRLCGPLGKA